jgi:hypothetical protein
MKKPYPPLPALSHYHLPLSVMVAETSYLPHPEVVAAFDGAVFPTVRARKKTEKFTIGETQTGRVMYDDNTTPRWAMMWAHGYGATARLSGWMHAHVWTAADEVDAYTHLANLVMIPESFGSLTDKAGPLTSYLRWHAWAKYGWKPKTGSALQEPAGYAQIKWRYLEPASDPIGEVRQLVSRLRNQRVIILRDLMQIPRA